MPGERPADATDVSELIRSGQLTATEAMRLSLAAAAHQSSLGAIAHLDATIGIAAARAADDERRSNPTRFNPRAFGGVPTLAKDLGGPFKGLPVAAGSRLFKRDGGNADSEVADRFRAAGFCLFGLTTSPEFGLSLASEPAIGPVCRNPHDPSRTAGGSSGGAAAAVAAGIVSIAHATDAGGSIRVPAACCGLIGLKPSRGAMPAGPSFGNHLGGIASEFVVTRSVRDTELALKSLGGKARGPFPDVVMTGHSPSGLRIGLLTDTGVRFPTAGDRLDAVEAAAISLEADGHAIVRLQWTDFETAVGYSARAFEDIVAVNLVNLVQDFNLDMTMAERLTQAVVEQGSAMPAAALWASLNKALLVSHHMWTVFDKVDCVLSPMLSSAPLAVGSFPSDHGDTELHFERMAAFAPLAPLANVSGVPALTLPFGSDAAGLPLPIQLMAPVGRDLQLLSLARRLEAEERWRHPFPIADSAA
ncbi:amidase [Rhizobium grahamii]|uniref:Indoleacetamide hydrolase n=1 Tax=Rhizobium grahamii TaxID=1120045 RepID=A0A370KGA4_9HYPH|nr:amidase [Rhizobium grahamii]RDJ03771.1 amidase [Rhizobium grahamii]